MTKPRRETPEYDVEADRIMTAVREDLILVHVDVFLPTELGGRRITQTVKARPEDFVVGYGKGAAAVLDCVVHRVKEAMREPAP